MPIMSNSLRLRGVLFAYLFGPPRFITRDEASALHGELCNQFHQDDFGFRYENLGDPVRPKSKGFRATIDRTEGRGSFQLILENLNSDEPMRLLQAHQWPAVLQDTKERFDIASSAVFKTLSGPWQKVVAEVRLLSQCSISDGNAIGFITHSLLAKPRWIDSLGKPLSFASIHLEVETGPSEGDPLKNPKRELKIEVLREDPSSLYLEFMTQWPQFPPIADERTIRQIDKDPSEYVQSAYVYMNQKIADLSREEQST